MPKLGLVDHVIIFFAVLGAQAVMLPVVKKHLEWVRKAVFQLVAHARWSEGSSQKLALKLNVKLDPPTPLDLDTPPPYDAVQFSAAGGQRRSRG